MSAVVTATEQEYLGGSADETSSDRPLQSDYEDEETEQALPGGFADIIGLTCEENSSDQLDYEVDDSWDGIEVEGESCYSGIPSSWARAILDTEITSDFDPLEWQLRQMDRHDNFDDSTVRKRLPGHRRWSSEEESDDVYTQRRPGRVGSSPSRSLWTTICES